MFSTATPYLKCPADPLSGILARVGAALAWWRASYALYRQRRALLALDDTMLKDLGISRVDALQEGNKPFWHP